MKSLSNKGSAKKDVQDIIEWSQVVVEIRSKNLQNIQIDLTEKNKTKQKTSEKKRFKLQIIFVF